MRLCIEIAKFKPLPSVEDRKSPGADVGSIDAKAYLNQDPKAINATEYLPPICSYPFRSSKMSAKLSVLLIGGCLCMNEERAGISYVTCLPAATSTTATLLVVIASTTTTTAVRLASSRVVLTTATALIFVLIVSKGY